MHNINIEEDGGLLPALQKYMKMIVIPQINKYDKWGSLMENKQGKQILPSIHPHSNLTLNLISSSPSSLFHLYPKSTLTPILPSTQSHPYPHSPSP